MIPTKSIAKGVGWGLGLTVVGTVFILPLLFFSTPDAAITWSPWIYMITSFVGVPFFVMGGVAARVFGHEMTKGNIVLFAYLTNPIIGGIIGAVIGGIRQFVQSRRD